MQHLEQCLEEKRLLMSLHRPTDRPTFTDQTLTTVIELLYPTYISRPSLRLSSAIHLNGVVLCIMAILSMLMNIFIL